MSIKLLVSLIVVSIFVVTGRQINGVDETDPEKDHNHNEMIDDDLSSTSSAPMTVIPSTSSPTTAQRILRNVNLCADLTPDFISSRSGGLQTLLCSVKICDDTSDDSETVVRFKQPLFDWNSGLGHILSANGTCDYERGHCWHSIDIDSTYFSDQMLDNGVTDLQFSCAVSDSLVDSNDNDIGWGFGSDFNSLKYFRGRALNERCDNDLQCGNNMFCLNSGRPDGPVCQCSVDFLTGVQFVQALDQKYSEWLCLPPLMINDSCLYDQQCQAMDINSVCKQTMAADSQMSSRCQCSEGMVAKESSCIPKSSDVTTKPTIIWWIFADNDSIGDASTHRYWFFRAASYTVALLAIILPICFIFIALSVLCYKRVVKSRSIAAQHPIRPTFPAPKLVINNLIKKDKNDDRFGLVKNDHLSGV